MPPSVDDLLSLFGPMNLPFVLHREPSIVPCPNQFDSDEAYDLWLRKARKCRDYPYFKFLMKTSSLPATRHSSASHTSPLRTLLSHHARSNTEYKKDSIVWKKQTWTDETKLEQLERVHTALSSQTSDEIELARSVWDPCYSLNREDLPESQHIPRFISRHAFMLAELEVYRPFVSSKNQILRYADIDARSATHRAVATEFLQWRVSLFEDDQRVKAIGFVFAKKDEDLFLEENTVSLDFGNFNEIAKANAEKNATAREYGTDELSHLSPSPTACEQFFTEVMQTNNNSFCHVVICTQDESNEFIHSLSPPDQICRLAQSARTLLSQLSVGLRLLSPERDCVFVIPLGTLCFTFPIFLSLFYCLIHAFAHIIFHHSEALSYGSTDIVVVCKSLLETIPSGFIKELQAVLEELDDEKFCNWWLINPSVIEKDRQFHEQIKGISDLMLAIKLSCGLTLTQPDPRVDDSSSTQLNSVLKPCPLFPPNSSLHVSSRLKTFMQHFPKFKSINT